MYQATGCRVVAVDGQSLRRSERPGRGLRPLPLVTARVTAKSLVPGPVPCDPRCQRFTCALAPDYRNTVPASLTIAEI